MKRALTVVLAFLLLCIAAPASAQAPQRAQTSPEVQLLWPVPVVELWGTVEFRGTANLNEQFYFFVEYAPLTDALSLPPSPVWFPATTAIQQRVVNGTLAQFDTTTIPDGAYAFRLTAAARTGEIYYDVVSPVRVSNARFAEIFGLTPGVPTPAMPNPVDNTPRAVVAPQYNAVNVRQCDLVDNFRCPVIGGINADASTDIIGVSNNGSGWYLVRLENGETGWVSPRVVTVSGDIGRVPAMAPPVPLPLPTAPPPLPTETPARLPNARPVSVVILGRTVCNRPFDVQVTIRNVSDRATGGGGTLLLQDYHRASNTLTYQTSARIPALDPQESFVFVFSVRTSVYYNDIHELRARIGNRMVVTSYTLLPGQCDD
jgi:hypothetical protein